MYFCILPQFRKTKEKGKEVLKKEKKKLHEQKRKKEKATKKKHSKVLASFCGLVVSCIVVCLN